MKARQTTLQPSASGACVATLIRRAWIPLQGSQTHRSVQSLARRRISKIAKVELGSSFVFKDIAGPSFILMFLNPAADPQGGQGTRAPNQRYLSFASCAPRHVALACGLVEHHCRGHRNIQRFYRTV